jgi:hypothetical protein
MNLLSRFVDWFLYSSTFFFAAGAVAAPPAGESSAAAPTSDSGSSSSQPAAPASTPEPNINDIVHEAAAEVEKELTQPAAAPAAETKPAAVETKPATTEPAKPAAETKPAAAETKPAAEANPLDKLGPLPAEKITAALAEAPEAVKAYLQEKGLSIEALSENARLAAQTSQFLEKVPSLEALDIALEGNANFLKLDQGLPQVQSVEQFDKFMTDVLVPMSFIRDANGQPIPDPATGGFKNDGSIAKLIDYSAAVRDSKIGELADMMLKAAATDDAKAYATDLKGAVDFLKQFISNGYKMPGSNDADAEKSLPPSVKERLARADQIERESRDRDARTNQAAMDQKENHIIAETDKVISPLIKDILDKTALSSELKTHIAETVWTKLVDQMQKNTLYQQQRDRLSPSAPDYEQRRVATNLTYMKERVVKLIESIVGKLGAPVVDANKARHDKIDSQSKAAAMEPKTSGTQPQSFPANSSTDQVHAKALELARAKNPNAKEGDADYWRAMLALDTPAAV